MKKRKNKIKKSMRRYRVLRGVSNATSPQPRRTVRTSRRTHKNINPTLGGKLQKYKVTK